MKLDVCDLQNTKNTQKAEPMICDDCFHNTVCRLDGNEMLEWCSARVPSANVVEVVRCEDCKHSVINHGRHCTFGDCLGCLVADDFFCKYGERGESK